MLELQNYLVRERVNLLKTVETYDIFDPETGAQVGIAEETPGALVASLRVFLGRKIMPTKVEVREHPEASLVFLIRKPSMFFRFREVVEVYDAEERRVGYFKSKLFSIGGGFHVYDDDDRHFAEVRGQWTGWEFTFVTPEGHEMGRVTKKWAGALKELFTQADNYVVSIADDLADQPIAKMLLLAATIAIDVVYYERED